MTREHKLAMIVGFALVLVVGVLVSDHLSGARKARIASVDMAGQEMGAREVDVAFGRKPEPAPTVTIAKRQAPPVTFDNEVDTGATLEEPIETLAAVTQAPEDPLHVADTGVLGFDAKLPPAIQTDSMEGERLVMGRPRNDPPGFIRVPEGDDSISALSGEPERKAPVVTAAEPAPAKVDKGKSRTIKDGDTLWSIAQDVYGDGKLSKKLAEYNKTRLGSGGQLREGASILIPEKDVLLGKAAATAKAPETKAEKTANSIAAKSEAGKKSSKSTYVVKKGDTLAAIAKRELGSAGRWEEILDLNSGDLEDETSIRPGMTLKLPR